jgi:hypothetical protein
MNEEYIHARHNFIVNGDFTNRLENWKVNDERKVTPQDALWQGRKVDFMNAVNMGEGHQTITLALWPRPTPGRADYKLLFHYEAVQNAVGTLRINPGRGGQVDLPLVPSRLAEPEQAVGLDGLLLELKLVEYEYDLTLDPNERTVKFTVISPNNGGVGRSGAIRFTFARVELLLEPLRLDSVVIDGESQSVDEKLHLCFGASHKLALELASDSIWFGTQAGLLVNDGEQDPEDILNASPSWGREHSVADPWTINCFGVVEDTEIERTLAVGSQYTADTYPLSAVCGHFQLDVVVLQEAQWYPVIDLDQSVDLRVRVQSYYTRTPLANREVTWTLKGANGTEDVVLLRQPSEPNGEAHFTWTPDTAGEWRIEASVDSHYKKENARYVFAVRVLKEDPWLSARFALDGAPRDWLWGSETGYPCRGATHAVTLAFATNHVLAETELTLHWQGNDTPDGLEMTFAPELDHANPVEGLGQVWMMECGNLRNSFFSFNVSCSKLLKPSPFQALELAHNWLEGGQVELPTRYPAVGGAALPLKFQVVSKVSGVGPVTGVDVVWSLAGTEDQTLSTGTDGWSQYDFNPQEEGSFTVAAKVTSRYDSVEIKHPFEITVLPENPLAGLTTVTLGGREAGAVGLLCIRDAEPVELLIKPVGETLVGECFYLQLTSDDGPIPEFHFEPCMDLPRRLPKEGLSWQVSSASSAIARFRLHVCHDEITPYELQGRLLSRNLEDEGSFTFDQRALDITSTAYPCLGGLHFLKFMPKVDSPLTGLEVAAQWVDESHRSLNARLEPDHERDLPSGGLEWTLDALNSTESGPLALALTLPQARFTYPAMTMMLAHNRIEIAEVRGPTFDMFVGQSAYLEIRNKSFYTGRSVPGIDVCFSHQGVSTPVRTQDNGWARFPFTATQVGNVQVRATVPSPYDGPDNFPSCLFEFTVLPAVVQPDSSSMSPPSSLPDKVPLIAEGERPVFVDAEIVEVREPTFDPVVAESVLMGLKFRSPNTRRAASGIAVTFRAGQETVQVVTDNEGWARFSYKALLPGNMEVLATLGSVNDSANAVRSHTFRFNTLAADVWGDALIQLDNVPKTVWGEETLFPRTPQVHTIKLSVDNAGSHLLDRDICLGLKGYSSARDLGLTSVQPALGVYRRLTPAGLSWQCTGTIGGAYALQLEASRLLKQSPVNAMSLGPVPPAGLSDGIPDISQDPEIPD